MIPYVDEPSAVRANTEALFLDVNAFVHLISRMGDALVLAVEGEDYLVEHLPSASMTVPELPEDATNAEALAVLAEYFRTLHAFVSPYETDVLKGCDKVAGILSSPMGVMFKRMMGL